MAQWYTQALSSDHVHPKSVYPWVCLSFGLFVLWLVCHILLLVFFFKFLIPYIGSFDKCHTSAVIALIQKVVDTGTLIMISVSYKRLMCKYTKPYFHRAQLIHVKEHISTYIYICTYMFQNLPALKSLNLSSNAIETFPDSILQCQHLEHLDLTYNKVGTALLLNTV